jgi:TIR domain
VPQPGFGARAGVSALASSVASSETVPDEAAGSPSAAKRARLFISCSDQSARVAGRLRDDLKKSGFVIWSDPAYPEPDTNAVRRVLEGLRASDTFLAVFAPDSGTCRRQSTEVALALARHRHIQRFVALTVSDQARVPPLMRKFVLADLSTATGYQRGLSLVRKALRTSSRDMSRRRLQQLQQLEMERAAFHRAARSQLRDCVDAAESLTSSFARLFAGAVSVGVSVVVAFVICQEALGGRFASGTAMVVASLASVTVGFFHGMRAGRGDLSSAGARGDVFQEAGR